MPRESIKEMSASEGKQSKTSVLLVVSLSISQYHNPFDMLILSTFAPNIFIQSYVFDN